jgi:hypothetical protein
MVFRSTALPLAPWGRDAAPVQQHQRARGAQAAQVRAAVAVVVAVGSAELDADVRRQVVGAGPVGRQLHHELLGAGDAAPLDLLAGDDLYRERAFLLHALDAAARDLDAFASLDGLRQCAAGDEN